MNPLKQRELCVRRGGVLRPNMTVKVAAPAPTTVGHLVGCWPNTTLFCSV
jgi:hypothetical protein